uniref:ATP synthase complex subunit 8 n=1 Tax=Trigonidium sjostedti TaxID=1914573 RepID=A0A1J0M4I5_9ORTH|nr:ATP synthase F0 subunit 8 [Trigonidium sjostedti]APD14957.1 ATP synthase F0 subunit 8 [Trigonidium sjostedti]
MPQMSPMNWLLLFLMFIMMFLMQLILNYFIIQPVKKSSQIAFLKKKSLSWKW